ncbi:MAG: AAA family ATPase [Chloroflexi bacterium]|nr:AAA family ATPase [Chloroflexota bacterium]
MEQLITDDLDALLDVLPPHLQTYLRATNRMNDLLEVVVDLGRVPEARFVHQAIALNSREVSREDIEYVVSRIGEFTDDNRAGIPRTLHRISCIRNRQGRVVGLTCRVGRAVYGTIEIIRDIVESGKSILLLGRPGVGKTTMLREAARVLGELKRVVIVDTSNEIGGDGDIPHPAVGNSRRMQVPTPALQHEVMIEAVENHMPEVIVIDEIGRELEAAAARTIAERGVQLIGTAHGQSLDNLMMNPTLADLIGGIQSVTLSDEEARRRGTQKSILERKAPPTFDVLIEIQERNRLAVHHEVADAVDALLRGRAMPAEIRLRDESGQVHIEKPRISPSVTISAKPARGRREAAIAEKPARVQAEPLRALRVYPYGLSQERLEQAAKGLQLPVRVVADVGQADAVLTLKNYYRKRPPIVTDAERRGVPVYVLRSNTIGQMEGILEDLFGVDGGQPDPVDVALREAQAGIAQVQQGANSIELSPQSAYVRRKQHELIRQANLFSRSLGKEPKRRVRIYTQDVAG